MRILLFGKNRKRRAARANTSKGLAIETYPLDELPGAIPSLETGTLVYVELKGLGTPQRQRVFGLIEENPDLLFGVLDPAGVVTDVASLFHVGAVDYLGKKMSASRLNAKRISQVLSFADGGRDEQADGAPPSVAVASSSEAPSDGWAGIVHGKEHEFAILFVEVDGSEELKKRHEPDNLTGALETFRAYVERIASQHGGRTWMWSQFGGLVLFPKSGSTSAPVCGLRLLLSRVFYDVEESPLPGNLSFHLALSIGRTVYKIHNTGEIISESLNSVFHLGKRFTRPSQFFVATEAMGLVPEKLKALCVPVGSYEGRKIFRLIPPRPVLPTAHDGQASG